MRSCIGIIATVIVVLTAAPCHAQDDPRILFSGPEGFERNPIGTALFNLGYRDITGAFQREDLLLPALRDGPWDLVIIRWYDAFEGPLAGDIIDELAAYVDGGGKLMFSMARLDEQPELWPILGIESAVDLAEPLQDIRPPRDGYFDSSLRHPVFSSRPALIAVDDPPPTGEVGDVLGPMPGSVVVAEYRNDLSPAIVLSHDGRVVVNGQQWDHWDPGQFFAMDQIRWLLECPADLDGDGLLTVFDFFEFQNRFDAGGDDGFADFCYDGRLDIFDFLEYLNLFEAGC